MNHEFAKQFENVLKGVEVRVPPQVAEIVEDNLHKARSAYETAVEGWKSYGDAVADVAKQQQADAQALSARALSNTTANVSAALDAARALTKTRSLQDAAKIQMDFAKAQSARMVEQSQDIVGLMSKMGADAMTAWVGALQAAGKR
ncbi:MAG: phasin family protein [Hyphomicrobium sp.]